ncbi:hypothetical protein NBRC116188_10290 [Oceaniserpentilla sp. 4NH20-0058]|uniref:hypothetical protein n=1 Tax=Oceaniserpentilla sp. 4NH20-0058 TaxID=3127660 RepID=UPI00310AFE15
MANPFFRPLIGLFVCCSIVACKPSEPEGSASGGDKTLAYDFSLSQSEFDALSAENQFMVANKLLSTMYRGVPVDEFFDLTQGLEEPVIQYTNFIESTQTALNTRMTDEQIISVEQDIFGLDDNIETEDVDESTPARFTNIDNNEPHQIFMARNQAYPLSKNQMEQWMSFFLANTIMFSPAREMDSTNNQDVDRVLGYLSTQLSNDASMRETVRGWLHNLSRWRVSRSPENHALEMFELYLGVFNDTEEEQQNTINGGKACSEWYLTDNNADYQLLKDNTQNGIKEPVKVFDQYITSCEDLYDIVAGHPLLVPRMVEVITNYFLDGMSVEEKLEVVEAIVATNPETFQDVFLAIMYSKAFLLESTRPKTFEENAFNFLHAMHYNSRANSYPLDRAILDRVYDSSNNGNLIGLHNMGWAAMDYKIGRTPFLPMDVLSFAAYHKAIRESVLLNTRAYDGRYFPETEDFTEETPPREPTIEIVDGAFYVTGTENLKPEMESLSPEEFIDFNFLTAMGRRATAEETTALIAEGEVRDYLRYYENESGVDELSLRRSGGGDDELYEYWADDYAQMILDYISRLPEFYYYRAVQ